MLAVGACTVRHYGQVLLRGAPSQAFASATTRLLDVTLSMERAPRDVSFDVNFVSLAQMRQVNYESRGIDAPTDVLTFSEASDESLLVNRLLFSESGEDGASGDEGHVDSSLMMLRRAMLDLGSIYVCVPYIAQRCQRRPSRNLPLALYMKAGLVHATLHLLGYAHETPEQLRDMVRREQQIGRGLTDMERRFPGSLPPLLLPDV